MNANTANTGTTTAEDRLWRQARQLFLDICTLPPGEREAFLCTADASEDVIQAVRRLLIRQDETTGAHGPLAAGPLADALAAALGRAESEPAPALDEFRIERTLGEGGMGRVYLAVRATGGVEQRVALKVVPSAAARPHLVEQLRRERAILANLEHPNIARLIEAGELADGRPYFAMEYVDGKPLTQYCDDAALPIARRLELFLDVVDAVAHAHRRFVLHRDLKAGNILVDRDGRVRLLDFGIAKSLDGAARDTTQGSNFFSLRAAAPEQVLCTATTIATDVYGLGCLLHELLSGRLPFGTEAEAGESLLRRIVEQPPPLASEAIAAADDETAAARRGFTGVSAHAAALCGDLDLIIARTLRKRPEERHASADALAEDLRSVLDLRPIAARASERWYRLRMLLRRHRLTAVAVGVLGSAVIATTALSILQSLRAGAERDRAVAALSAARLQRDHAERVTDFLVNAFRSPDPVRGELSEMRATEMLDRAADTLEKNAADLGPLLHARLAQTLAHIFYLIEHPAQTRRQADAARRQLERLQHPPLELLVHQDLADAEAARLENRYTDAVALSARGLARIPDPAAFDDHRVLHQLWRTRVLAMSYSGDNLGTVRIADEALAVLTAHPQHIAAATDYIRQRRAAALSASGDFAATLQPLIALRDEQRAAGRDGDGSYVDTLRLLGQSYLRNDDMPAAIQAYEEAVRRHEAVYGVDNSRLALLLTGVASAYALAGRRLEATYLFVRATAMNRRINGEIHPATANTYLYGADRFYGSMDNLDAAADWMARSVAASPPQSKGSLHIMQQRLAQFRLLQGRTFEAHHYYSESLPELRRMYRSGIRVDMASVGLAYLLMQRYEFDRAAGVVNAAAVSHVLAEADDDPRLHRQAQALRDFFGERLYGPAAPPLRR